MNLIKACEEFHNYRCVGVKNHSYAFFREVRNRTMICKVFTKEGVFYNSYANFLGAVSDIYGDKATELEWVNLVKKVSFME